MSAQLGCPQCGGALQVVTLGGDHAPWLCAGCHLGFWDAELHVDHRKHWRPAHQDFGYGPHVQVIRAAVQAQWQAQRRAQRAAQRGGA